LLFGPRMTALWESLEHIVEDMVVALRRDPAYGALLDGHGWARASVRELYGYFLAQTHGYVLTTEPFLAASARTFAASDDPFQRSLLAERAADHEREEAGHAAWLVRDYAALGFDVAGLATAGPSVRAYNAYVTFIASSPREVIASFGVAAVLEGVAVRLGQPMAENIARTLGDGDVSPKALRRNPTEFIAKHGATDAHHTRELRELCEVLEHRASAADRRRIVHCAETVAQLYRNLMLGAAAPRAHEEAA
jgi:hypothetical protein